MNYTRFDTVDCVLVQSAKSTVFAKNSFNKALYKQFFSKIESHWIVTQLFVDILGI